MSIKVAVRVRPLNDNERRTKSAIVVRMNGGEVDIIAGDHSMPPHKFAMDHAFWSAGATVTGSSNPEVSQNDVFQTLGVPLITSTFTGYNSCIFAYGQTGSGKTHSMMGPAGAPPEGEGLVPRFATALFDKAADLAQNGSTTVGIEVSYFEIYCEKVRCLLNPQAGGFEGVSATLKVREHPVTGPYVEGLARLAIANKAEFLQLMREGNAVRTTAATSMNATSSRSHAVFTVIITQRHVVGAVTTTKISKMNLVDLAGSERSTKTGATGQRLVEGSNINKSLTSLGQVISALAEEFETGKSRHVPYRDSVLTWVLKDNLGGNSQTVMLAAISPSADNIDETLSTMRYAERTKKIVNKAIINESNDNVVIAKLQSEIARLKEELGKGGSGEHVADQLLENERFLKELNTTWAERLQETEAVLLARHAAMEAELAEKDSNIQALANQLSAQQAAIRERDSQIAALRAQLNKSQAQAEVERIRSQLDELERTPIKGAPSVPALRGARNPRGDAVRFTTEVRAEDLGDNVRNLVQNEGGKVNVRALARAYEMLAQRPDEPPKPASKPRAPAAQQAGGVTATPDSAPADDGDDLDLEGDDLDLDDADDGIDEGDEEVDLDLDIGDDVVLPEEGGSAAAVEEDADDLDIQGDDLDIDLEAEEQAAAAAAGGDDTLLDLDEEDLIEELDIEEDEGQKVPATTAAAAVAAPAPKPSTTTATVTPASTAAAAPALPKAAVASSAALQEAMRQHEAQVNSENKSGVTATSETTNPRARALTVATGGSATPAAATSSETKKGDVVATLVIPSHALPNNRFLREPFRVTKVDENAFMGSKKERIWDVDFFGHKFSNLDLQGVPSFSLPSSALFRVEKDWTDPRRITLFFFDAPHPYELVMSGPERRQRLYELAMVQRRHAILWCPSLCPDGDDDAVVQVVGTTIDRQSGRSLKVKGDGKFQVARMPYEVIDFWFGCFGLQNLPLPATHQTISNFIPKATHDVYVIGVTDIPGNLMGTSDLGDYFCAYLGATAYFVVYNSCVESRDKPKRGNNGVLVIVRRSFIVRVCQVEGTEIGSIRANTGQKGDFAAVGVTLRINETSFCCILVNSNPLIEDPNVRAANIRALIASFPLGNSNVDISNRFDYLCVGGAFGFNGAWTPEDQLTAQMKADNVFTEFTEAPLQDAAHSHMPNPMRIVTWVRPRNCRLDVKRYGVCDRLKLPNAFVSCDAFTQRPFLSVFGEVVPRNLMGFKNVAIKATRMPGMIAPELHVIAGWVEPSPLVVPLVRGADGMFSIKDGRSLSVRPCVNNLEYLRLQTITFTIMAGIANAKDKKKDKVVIASGSLSLKHQFTPGQAVEFTTNMMYRTCTVGTIKGSLLVTHTDTGEYHGASTLPPVTGEHSTAVYTDENQVLDAGGTWVPSLHGEGAPWDWTSPTDQTPARRESFVLPEGWKWMGDWIHERRQDDAAGWYYATTWSNADYVFQAAKQHHCRRRRWMRVMQAPDAVALHNWVLARQ